MKTLVFAAAMVGVSAAALATAAESAAVQPIYDAIRHGDCVKAVKAVNAVINAQDAQVNFLVGRMLDEGVCVRQDSVGAADYYKQSLELGNPAAGLEYAAKVGMGEGAPQSYESAGTICRTAGLDAAGQLSAYSLGYVCTIRSVAGKMLRESLPKNAIIRGGGASLVSFTASSGVLLIRSLPHVAMADVQVGTNIQHPVIDARAAIQKAWRVAVATVPKPDLSRLEGRPVDLPLDLEMSIEPGSDSGPVMQHGFFGGDFVRPNLPSTPSGPR